MKILKIVAFFIFVNIYSYVFSLSPKSTFSDNQNAINAVEDLLKIVGLNDSIYGNQIFGIPTKNWIKKHGEDITPRQKKDRYTNVDDDPYKHEYAFIIRDSPGIKDAKKRIIALAKRYFDDLKVQQMETMLESVKLKHLKIAKKRFRKDKSAISKDDEIQYSILRNLANEVSHPPYYVTKGFTHLYSKWGDNDIPLWNLKIWIVDDNGNVLLDKMKEWMNSKSKKPTLEWFKALNEGRVKSFYDLFENIVNDDKSSQNEIDQKILPYVWESVEGVHVRKKDEIHVFKTFFDAVRSTFIHEIDSIIADIFKLKITKNVLSKLLDESLQLDINFTLSILDITNVQKNIGNEYKDTWGEAKKKSWEYLELAKEKINNSERLDATFKEALIYLNKQIQEKKTMIKRIRSGRIEALKKEIFKRNSIFEENINSILLLLSKGKYKEAKLKVGYMIHIWDNYKNEPDFFRMNNALGLLNNLLSAHSRDMDRIINIANVIKKQIIDSFMLYDFFVDYVDYVIKLNLDDNFLLTNSIDIFSIVFDDFVYKYSLKGEDAKERALLWAKLNQSLNISHNNNDLYKASSLLIRIIEYAYTPNLLLNKILNNESLINTKKVIEGILKYRKKLLREDLPYIIKAIAEDFSLKGKDWEVLFKCILPEKRKQAIYYNPLKQAA